MIFSGSDPLPYFVIVCNNTLGLQLFAGANLSGFLEIVHLLGTYFSNFSKLAFYLVENIENLIFAGTNTCTCISENRANR